MIRNGRRTLAALLALIMVLVLLPTVSAKADGEIEISNYEQLKAFAARVNARETGLNAKLTADITCTDKTWTPIGNEHYRYGGTFNGQGYKIIGLSNADVDYSGLSDDFVYIGLFGRSGGTVENVVLEDCDLSFASDADGRVYMGAAVGKNDGTVKACSVSGKLSAALTSSSVTAGIGGVVGYNINTVKTCTNSGAVSVSGNIPSIYVGGVVGYSGGAEQYCANTGAVTGAGRVTVGGVVGYCNSVKNCFNTGAVSGYDAAGGIVGFTTYGTVENCLNVGTVTGDSHTGGVIGQNNYGTVKTCLSVGAVSGSGRYIGGVVGMCPNNASVTSYVENCYYLNTAASAAIGAVGTATVTNVAALTAEQLKSLSNCVGFSTDTWYEGLSYPVLKDFSAEIHLYANSDEDLVLQHFICAYVPTAFANPFTYADHEFTGWNTNADGDGDPYDETHEFTLLPGEILTLYAQWRVAAFTITFQNEDGSELSKGLVNVNETPVYTGNTPTKAPTVEHLYTFAGWKDADGVVYTDALPAVTGEATYIAVYTESDRVYTGPVWAWDGYESATATFTATDDTTFTQVLTATGDAITNAVTTQPTCTEPGERTYTAKVSFLGKVYTNDKTEPIDATGHDWGEPTYEWTEIPGGYVCTATRVCNNNAEDIETETVGSTYAVITEPDLKQNGLGRYTSAAFENEAFAVQTKDVVIPMLALGLYGEDVNAFDVAEYTEDGTLYRYDVKFKSDAGALPIVSMQAFIGYDADALTLVEAKTELPGSVTTHDENGVFSFAWANDEGVDMESGAVVVSLYFKLDGTVGDGDVLLFPFTDGDFQNTAAYLEDGAVTEAAAFETEDGSIAFAVPELTIAGEDVLSGDVYVIEDGKVLYRYDVRAKDLPAAGLMINSAQIFLGFDHDILAVAKTEGVVDWTTSDDGSTFMASWASDTEAELKENDIVLTLWFTKIGPAPEDGVVPIIFTVNPLGFESAVSITFAGAVTELEANTVDGSITFEKVLYGDANCDGQVTAADAALILRAIVGLSELSPRGVLNADADGDLEVTAEDAAAILRYVVGLIEGLPA